MNEPPTPDQSPNFEALIMRHVAMLIIFSRRIVIRAVLSVLDNHEQLTITQ